MHSIFQARGIRGIILTPTPRDEEPPAAELAAFPWDDYSIIRFGQSLYSIPVNYVSSAQINNTILAFERIHQKGYQRIGYVGEHLRLRLFSAGYLWAQQALPKSQQLPPLFIQAGHYAQWLPLLNKWLQQQKPDAIIYDTNISKALKELGYRVPDDIGIASVSIQGDYSMNAGIDQNPEEIGRTAIRTLISHLNANINGIPRIQKEILVEGRWAEGSMLPDLNIREH